MRLVIDDAGDVVKDYTYEPFAEIIDSSGSFDNSFMFTGQYFDSEIEEYYLRARQYNPHIARFTARDPVNSDFQEPLTLHKYLYCMNDPINRVDLTGNRPIWTRYDFWALTGDEVLKSAAATLDGLIPIPCWNPFEDVYADDGSIAPRYRFSRLSGSVARSALMFALNAKAVKGILSSGAGAGIGATLVERVSVGVFWKGALVENVLGNVGGLTWGASNAALTTLGIGDNILDFIGLFEDN